LLNLATETDIERLRQAALLLEQENARLFQRLKRLAAELREARGEEARSLQLEIEHLKEQLASRTRALFGDSSEQRTAGDPKAKQPKEPQPGHGPREQKALPIVEVVHDLDEPDQACPSCGGHLQPMAGQFEEADEIDVVERSFRIVRHKRQKYRCRCGAGIETALGPDKLVPGGRYSIDFAVDVAIAKFADHRVPRRHAQPPRGRRSKPCCMEDEGRPLGIGVQAQVPNHLELRGSRARVVSVEGNGAARPCQVRSKKTNASEPLMTCREESIRRRNRAGWLARDEPRGSLQTGWVASGMKAA
jgi:hypothetical protein